MDFDESMMRKDKRFDSLNLADVEIFDTQGNGIYMGIGKTLNVSLSGLMFAIYDLNVPIQLTYRVKFLVSLEKGGEIVNLKGIIRWIHKNDSTQKIGVMYEPLTKKVYDALNKFLDQIEK
ncbi:PilZ domain-containing protein [bacterium]|nr:PilZ domain-containing protein [bacterium]